MARKAAGAVVRHRGRNPCPAGRDLDEPQPLKETYGFRTAGWNVAPVVSKTVSRIAPMLGVRPDKRREPNMAEVLPFVRKED